MHSNHSISDLVARIKNGYKAKKLTIETPKSKIGEKILLILKNEGYILSYSRIKDINEKELFLINLKYHNDTPCINDISVISKPGKRVYSGFDKIPSARNGLGIIIVSTSQGLIQDYIAKEKKIGGELLLEIF